MQVWNALESGFTAHYGHDFALHGWLHTWAGQFSPSDARLMIGGVVSQVGGEIAVFNTGESIVVSTADRALLWSSRSYFGRHGAAIFLGFLRLDTSDKSD